ncbi:MAG: hypothetical protein ACFFDN_14750 [Candidatus Hodarchaeota archaeon]
MKKLIISFLIPIAFFFTIISMPLIDYSEGNVFFYLNHLPIFYQISIFLSIYAILLFRKNFFGILYVLGFILLLLFTPNFMLVNPWSMDSYPFVASALYVSKNGHIGPFFGIIEETPCLSLLFGSFLLITDINPIIIAKYYTAFITIILGLIFYCISNKCNFGKEISVITPMLFVSIFWPNELHFSRQSISLIFYLISWYLLFSLVIKRSRKIYLFLIIQIFILVLSHPATSFFFFFNLIAVVIIGLLTRKIQKRNINLISNVSVITILLWSIWNINYLPTSKASQVWRDVGERLIQSLLQNPSEISGLEKIFFGYTPTYEFIINIRLLITFIIYISVLIFPLIIYFKYNSFKTNIEIFVISVCWAVSNLLIMIPLLYVGLPFFARPVLFTFLAWPIIGTMLYKVLQQLDKNKIKILFIITFILVPSFLLPVIKYAPLPFIFPTKKELNNFAFLNMHWENSRVLYVERPPLFYFWMYNESSRIGGLTDPPGYLWVEVYSQGEGLDMNRVNQTSIWITSRILARDAFWNFVPNYHDVINNLILYENSVRNKVFDAGWPEYLYTHPRRVG